MLSVPWQPEWEGAHGDQHGFAAPTWRWLREQWSQSLVRQTHAGNKDIQLTVSGFSWHKSDQCWGISSDMLHANTHHKALPRTLLYLKNSSIAGGIRKVLPLMQGCDWFELINFPFTGNPPHPTPVLQPPLTLRVPTLRSKFSSFLRACHEKGKKMGLWHCLCSTLDSTPRQQHLCTHNLMPVPSPLEDSTAEEGRDIGCLGASLLVWLVPDY